MQTEQIGILIKINVKKGKSNGLSYIIKNLNSSNEHHYTIKFRI